MVEEVVKGLGDVSRRLAQLHQARVVSEQEGTLYDGEFSTNIRTDIRIYREATLKKKQKSTEKTLKLTRLHIHM